MRKYDYSLAEKEIMTQYIDKSAVEAEIKRIEQETNYEAFTDEVLGKRHVCKGLLSFLDNLEVKEVKEQPASTTLYVVTRCEEHSDYVEEAFFDENKAQEYCDKFKENENEYARHITRVEVILKK